MTKLEQDITSISTGSTLTYQELQPAPCRCTSELIRQVRPDTPTMCFSGKNLVQKIREFQSSFPGLLTFAVKASPMFPVIKEMIDHGIDTFDVASLIEMDQVRRQLPVATFHYNNPVKSRSEIEKAYNRYDVRHFTVDDEIELEKIASIVPNDHRTEIAVRFKLNRKADFYNFASKFGADLSDSSDLLLKAINKGFKVSLSFHPGSQTLDPKVFVEHIEAAREIVQASGVKIERLNVGGGFPAPYPNSGAAPLTDFFSAIDIANQKLFPNSRLKLIAEPGRALVATCMSTVTRIKHRRPNGDIFLNDGTYGAFLELMLVDYQLPIRVFNKTGEALTGITSKTKIFGPTCDSMDCLPGKIDIPVTAKEGDWIEFGLTGAYSTATKTKFNGYGKLELIHVEDILT